MISNPLQYNAIFPLSKLVDIIVNKYRILTVYLDSNQQKLSIMVKQ